MRVDHRQSENLALAHVPDRVVDELGVEHRLEVGTHQVGSANLVRVFVARDHLDHEITIGNEPDLREPAGVIVDDEDVGHVLPASPDRHPGLAPRPMAVRKLKR